MKHFQDEDYNSMKDYETHVPSHFNDDNSDDYEGSLVFRHWLEDDDSDDYDGSLVFIHWKED